MPGRASRRSVLRGCAVAASGFLAGCSAPTLPGSGGASRARPKPRDVTVRNSAETGHEVSVTLLRTDGSPGPDLPRTVTTRPPPNARGAVLQERVELDPDDSKRYDDVFPVPDEPVEYRVFVELESGGATGYAFEDNEFRVIHSIYVSIRPGPEIGIGLLVS